MAQPADGQPACNGDSFGVGDRGSGGGEDKRGGCGEGGGGGEGECGFAFGTGGARAAFFCGTILLLHGRTVSLWVFA